MNEIEEYKRMIKNMAAQKKKPRLKKPALSSGSTLLNLACTGTPHGCFRMGYFYYIVGDSSSGKTFLTLTCFAEAAKSKSFKNHRLIFDNSEGGALMDFKKFFGSKMADRVDEPSKGNSITIEDFYYSLDDALKEKKPFIYVLDSMDSLTSKYANKKFTEGKVQHRKGKDAKGSYGDGKAKINSEYMRKVIPQIKENDSILIVLSQTRDNINASPYESKKTRAGGRSLTFYATLEIWSSIKKRLKKTVRKKERQIGILAKCDVKKNRITGRDRTVELPIYHSFGFDDVEGCIRYLVSENHWKVVSGTVKSPEFEYTGKLSGLIKLIEEGNKENELKTITAQVWNEIEDALKVDRKKRYE